MATDMILCASFGIFLILLLPVHLAQQPEFDYEYRLPTHITPLIYDLKLTLSSYREEVIGQVEIQIQCEREAEYVELHANPLFVVVENSSIESRLLGEVHELTIPIGDHTRQTIRYNVPFKLKKKHVYYLRINFTTKYSFDERGLVRNQDVIRGTWFNTLFEPSHARRLFPTFDQPHWRSSFKLELKMEGEYSEDGMVALSSTNVEKIVRESSNLTSWHFFATPPIPTYIFTLAAGRFRSVCNSSALHGKEICIWRFSHCKNWESMAQSIISATARFQGQVTDYLLSDPVARLHFLIAPSNLKGMENFGLLNIGEKLWPTSGDSHSLQLFAKTLYHEITHQWFGNLVTLQWWKDIWLVESITTFLSSFKPLEVDLQSDRSIDPLISSKWASGIPSLSYTKGPIILEMLNLIVGPERMRRLLREYIRVHQFGHATTDSFLSTLNAVTSDMKDEVNYSVAPVEFMSAWLYQGSYPIVFVDYDEKVHQFILTQTPKLVNNQTSNLPEWPIPIWTSCQLDSVEEKLRWIKPGQELLLHLVNLTLTNDRNGVVFNRNKTVYYKVIYRY